VRLLIRVYDIGVVSIVMRVACQAGALAELAPLHHPTLDNGQTMDEVARKTCGEVCKSLRDVLVQPSEPSEPEAYTVFCLTGLGTAQDVNPWLADNLVVIDWDAALVVDLNGYVDDVLYVLELANLQLEEYRVMDQRLDRHLDRAYDDLKRQRFRLWGTPVKMLSTLRLFRVDVTKLNDEVTHISKFFGDWYLARVYLGAAERFYLNQWRQSVADRLGQLDQLYSVVNSDINNQRMVWLEVIVVIFFAIDLLLLTFRGR
jgi:hypothetical protein